jgi:hypothetical protein
MSSSGKLKIRPGCPTCIAKSALNPKVFYDRVVCSVCGGTGIVQPKPQPSGVSKASIIWLGLASLVVIAALSFMTRNIMAYKREAYQYRDLVDELTQSEENSRSTLSQAELLEKVRVGMTKDQVKEELGDPDSIRSFGTEPATTELWRYNCTDGHVVITIYNEAVQVLYR